MDRVINVLVLSFAATVLVLGSAENARAGTGFVEPLRVSHRLKNDQDYPPSAFGQAPAEIDMGVSDHYAAKMTEEMDEASRDEDEAGAGSRRAPAGLEFSSDQGGKAPVSRAQPGSRGGSQPRVVSQTAIQKPLPRMESVNPRDGGTVLRDESVRKGLVSGGIQEVALIASDLGYFPKTFFVTRDLPVRLFVTGASKSALCIMMDSFQVRRQVRSQRVEEINFTPSLPGKYRFYCPVNGMEGLMVVKEFSNSVEGGSEATASRAPGQAE